MPKVSKQTAAKGGLMVAILGMIGNVIGVGIFFKNKNVFYLNASNAFGVLISWLLSTLIVLFMAISFAEIASCKTKTGKAGIGPWADEFCGHKFGRYCKLGYNLIFWPLNTFAMFIFAGEALLNCFAPLSSKGWAGVSQYDYGAGTTAYVFIIGAVLFTIFMIANYFRYKSMGKVGRGISYVKFLPLTMIVVIGIVFGILYNNAGLWTHIEDNAVLTAGEVVNSAPTFSTINWAGTFGAIPAILFAFEGYVAIDSFKNDLSNPDKQIPLGVVIGVIVISALYFAVTIGCITAGKGDVYQLFNDLFGSKNPTVVKILTTIISVLIFTCLIGCVNGMARGGITTYQELCKEGALFKGKALINKKPGNDYFAGLISFAVINAFWFIFLSIPSIIWNTDAIADGSSVSMVIVLYVIYGSIVMSGFINRFTNKVNVKKNKIFPVASIVGVIGCLFVVCYVAGYQMTYAPIVNGLGKINDYTKIQGEFPKLLVKAGWGMFVNCSNTHLLTNLEVLAWFWAMTIIAAASPIINDLLIKGFDKQNKQPLMWQKVNKQVALK